MTSGNVADLVIPPAAVDAYFVCGCSESGIRAGYKPEALPAVVAAELRRIANAQTARARGLSPRDNAVSVASLRARADELDPPTREDGPAMEQTREFFVEVRIYRDTNKATHDDVERFDTLEAARDYLETRISDSNYEG